MQVEPTDADAAAGDAAAVRGQHQQMFSSHAAAAAAGARGAVSKHPLLPASPAAAVALTAAAAVSVSSRLVDAFYKAHQLLAQIKQVIERHHA